ncbi:hypothetical protein CLU93_5572 [Janthinobacterium sp. 35]|nr:hypothetical protein CLU93_5572 [Janthinobacterium sp. 35]
MVNQGQTATTTLWLLWLTLLLMRSELAEHYTQRCSQNSNPSGGPKALAQLTYL